MLCHAISARQFVHLWSGQLKRDKSGACRTLVIILAAVIRIVYRRSRGRAHVYIVQTWLTSILVTSSLTDGLRGQCSVEATRSRRCLIAM